MRRWTGFESSRGKDSNGKTKMGTRGVLRHAGVLALWLFLLFIVPGSLAADENGASDVWEALTQGKPVLNIRGRIEIGKVGTLNRSEAYTLRTRLGYGTKPYHGVRVYAEFENIATPDASTYFNPNFPPNSNRLTPIADPPGTEVNQGFLEINRPDWLGSSFIGGRQQIVLDDSRFIGDVIWRQNMQTYDAAYFKTTAGIDDFMIRYGWIGHVNRIFGGGGDNPALADFSSNSHIVNASFGRFKEAKLVLFAYLLDLTLPALGNPQVNSNQSYGGRLTGTIGLGGDFGIDYAGSYAYQKNFAGKTPNYGANYGSVDVGLKHKSVGKVGSGFELLGSDNGTQQFLTPLSTAHKFNGWADVFLDNGGPAGLRDFYAYVMPKLPWQLKMRLVYHRFWFDATGQLLGNEFDASVGRSFGKHFALLFKTGYFNAADGSPRPTTYRIWTDITIKF